MKHLIPFRLRSIFLTLAMAAVLAAPAHADARHNSRRAGHPLRFIAYVLHPVGYMIDSVVLRPLHWMVSRDGLDEVFGHTES